MAKKKPSLGNDLKKVTLPFDLYTGFFAVIEEMKNKGFEYTHMTLEKSPILTFVSEALQESVLVSIESETLLIRQFLTDNEKRKLKVIYVVKATERSFKLV